MPPIKRFDEKNLTPVKETSVSFGVKNHVVKNPNTSLTGISYIKKIASFINNSDLYKKGK
jgi:hypothetical protein